MRRKRLIALAAVLAFGVAACGGDDDDSESSDTTAAAATTTAAESTETSAPSDETTTPEDETTAPEAEGSSTTAAGGGEGCGPEAVTDLTDLSSGRTPARCEPGFPEPQPLAEPTTLTLTTAFRAEFVAPILLGISMGEFEKENLTVEIQELGFADALPLMASGDVDLAVGGTEAAFFNAINSGIETKWALANFSPPDAGDASIPQTGLWARRDAFSNPDQPDLAELAGKTMASAVGNGSTIAYPIEAAFEEVGLTLNDLTVQQIPSPDMVTALENNGVQAAWLLDPYWIQASQNPDFVLLATQPPGEPLGGLYFAPHLLTDERDAAVAFARAYIRSINTYLSGDYQTNDEVMAQLSEDTGTSVENLDLTPALTFDWEMREGTTDRVQDVFIKLGSANYTEPIPENQVIDRSIYLEAIGAE